jgi:hypothetical protein
MYLFRDMVKTTYIPFPHLLFTDQPDRRARGRPARSPLCQGITEKFLWAHISPNRRLNRNPPYVATFVGRPIAVEEFFPAWHRTYIHLKLIPKMKAAGITDSQIRTMLVDNPRSLFEGA